jgi:hypothetical protein
VAKNEAMTDSEKILRRTVSAVYCMPDVKVIEVPVSVLADVIEELDVLRMLEDGVREYLGMLDNSRAKKAEAAR